MASEDRLRVGTVKYKIVRFLKKHPRRIFSPKQIAANLYESPGTVRSALKRMLEFNDPPIKKEHRGLYRCAHGPDTSKQLETPPPQLHGLQLTLDVPRNKGLPPRGSRFLQENRQSFVDRVWEGRKVTVSWSESSGKIQISMTATEDPLELQEFGLWKRDMKNWLMGMGVEWSERHLHVDNVEFNLDFRKVILRGMKSYKVGAFENAWLQVYNKTKEMTRAEIRWSPQELTGEEFENILLGALRGPQDGADVEAPAPPEPTSEEVFWS